MTSSPLMVGVSACFFHADPTRALFKGKTLLYLEQSMGEYLMREGAIPVMLPPASVRFEVRELLESLDGLLLQGGTDVAPHSYGEEPLRPEWAGDIVRDRYETELIKVAMDMNRPVLGICRGHQILNVALGGTLYQDINTQVEGSLVHRNWDVYEDLHQEVVLEEGSSLREIYGGVPNGRINSIHHQSIKDVAPSLRVEARSPEDGIIEGICLDDSLSEDAHHQGRYALGVQWHPEFIASKDASLLDPGPLMNHFLEQVRANKNRK